MATYKGIQGYSVQKLSSDPTASSDTEGQLWYNSTAGKFKISTAGAGAWASVNAIPAVRQKAGGCGITTAGLYVGGSPALGTALEFDGTDWTIGGTLNRVDAYSTFTAGTQTAAVAAGGYTEAAPAGNKLVTEEYDGTSWTTGNDMVGTARDGGACAGIQTAAIAMGGQQGPKKEVEEYDGTSWTAGTATTSNHPACFGAQSGTQTATLCIGGADPGTTEKWNGTSWTELNDINSARAFGGSGGTSTAAMIVGGYNLSSPGTKFANTETFDGTSWTEVGDLAEAKSFCLAFGTGSAAILGGGVAPPSPSTANSTTAEQWSDPVYTIKTVTVS